MQLHPVTFHYKQAANEAAQRPLQYGLIAAEVAKVLSEIVAFDAAGAP